MTTLVVFETMYGRTRDVAQSVAIGCESGGAVSAVEVTELVAGDAPGALPDGVALLVVGGPTHAFGMTRPNTRRDAAKYGATVSRTAPSSPSGPVSRGRNIHGPIGSMPPWVERGVRRIAQ